MNKLSHMLLASLAVLLLSKELQAKTPRGITLRIIKNIKDFKKYTQNGTEMVLKPFRLVEGKGLVLGDDNSGGTLVFSGTAQAFYSNANGEPTFSSFDKETEITYVELGFRQNVNGGKAVLAAGGIGENYLSVVVEVPQAKRAQTFYVNVYGNDVV